LRATITRVPNGMWVLNTYKDSTPFEQFRINGLWSTEIKGKGKPVIWHVQDHSQVTFIGGKLTDAVGERIDNHRDTNLLNHKIVGENIIFTKEGVFAIIAEDNNMNQLGEKLLKAGITSSSVEQPKQVATIRPTSNKVNEIFELAKKASKDSHNKQMQSLADFYCERYGTPKSDMEALKILHQAYTDLIGVPTPDVNEAIAEYYRLITARDLPAFYWLIESFHVVSKKDTGKQTMAYTIGILRSWLKFGFGHIPSSEEDDVLAYIQEKLGVRLSQDAQKVVQSLLGNYGAVKCTIGVAELKEGDYSYFVALTLKNVLENRFGVKQDGA
jgi:hypothetical protein